MTTILIVFAGILSVFLAHVVVVPILSNFSDFSRRVPVHCPNLETPGRVRLKPLRAALFSTYGIRNLQVWKCTLLGRREKCNGACLEQVEI